ncbi:MAG TPA: GIY-YIG nuclease family protein [Candidatus Methylomirabilis sp.]|nr:GIY-YIG nuclease family protein [Candidatus Methylomirabilis sp.]
MSKDDRPAAVRAGDAGAEKPWYVYIMECSDGSLYTGVTNDIERRHQQHNDGSASRYTRSRRPVVLRYQEVCGSRSEALIRECAVRLLSRKEKETLINRGK